MLVRTSHPETFTRSSAPPTLRRVAHHLDAALRHAEALRALERPAATGAFSGLRVGALIRQNREQETAAQEACALELSIVLRLQQARNLLNQAGRETPSRAALLRLIATTADTLTTADLRATVGSAGDYFASRGLVAISLEAIAIGEEYRVCGLVPLGALMDAVAAALDLIDSLGVLSPT